MPWHLESHARAYLKVVENVRGTIPCEVAKALVAKLNKCLLAEHAIAIIRAILSGVPG